MKINAVVWILAILIAAAPTISIENTVFSDVNNDGLLDFYLEVLIQTTATGNFYYRNATDGIGNIVNVTQGYFVDVNGDNREDLYIVRRNAPNYLYLWTANFRFTNATATNLGRNLTGNAGSPLAAWFEDINGNNITDAFVNGQLFLDISNPALFRNATNISNVDEIPRLKQVKITDINLDGDKDILGTAENGTIVLFLSLGDFNGDNCPEFYDATYEAKLSQITNVNFAEAADLKIGLAVNKTINFYPFYGQTPPFVADNFTDIYFARAGANQLLIQLFPDTRQDYRVFNGSMFYIPTFLERSDGVADASNSTVAVFADFDNNTYVDLLVGNNGNGTQVYLRNASSWNNTFVNASVNFSIIANAKLLQTADVDNNGSLDIAYIDASGIYTGIVVSGTSAADVSISRGGTPYNGALENQVNVDTMLNMADLALTPTPGPEPRPTTEVALNSSGQILISSGTYDARNHQPQEPPGPPAPGIGGGGGGTGGGGRKYSLRATIRDCFGNIYEINVPTAPMLQNELLNRGYELLLPSTEQYKTVITQAAERGILRDPSINIGYFVLYSDTLGTLFATELKTSAGSTCYVYPQDLETGTIWSKCYDYTFQCTTPITEEGRYFEEFEAPGEEEPTVPPVNLTPTIPSREGLVCVCPDCDPDACSIPVNQKVETLKDTLHDSNLQETTVDLFASFSLPGSLTVQLPGRPSREGENIAERCGISGPPAGTVMIKDIEYVRETNQILQIELYNPGTTTAEVKGEAKVNYVFQDLPRAIHQYQSQGMEASAHLTFFFNVLMEMISGKPTNVYLTLDEAEDVLKEELPQFDQAFSLKEGFFRDVNLIISAANSYQKLRQLQNEATKLMIEYQRQAELGPVPEDERQKFNEALDDIYARLRQLVGQTTERSEKVHTAEKIEGKEETKPFKMILDSPTRTNITFKILDPVEIEPRKTATLDLENLQITKDDEVKGQLEILDWREQPLTLEEFSELSKAATNKVCREDDDCEEAEACVDNFCVIACRSDEDCPAGSCLPEGYCGTKPECETDIDCNPGTEEGINEEALTLAPQQKKCVGGNCASSCKTDTDCEEAQCKDGACRPYTRYIPEWQSERAELLDINLQIAGATV